MGVAMPRFQVRQRTRIQGQRSGGCLLPGRLQIGVPRWRHAVAQTARQRPSLPLVGHFPSRPPPLPPRREHSLGRATGSHERSHRLIHAATQRHETGIDGLNHGHDGAPSGRFNRLFLLRFAIETRHWRKLPAGYFHWKRHRKRHPHYIFNYQCHILNTNLTLWQFLAWTIFWSNL